MSFWGKVLGALFGFMFLKIPGAILGLVVGHFFDKAYSQDFNHMGGFGRFFSDKNSLKQQAIFFHSLFSALGHLAKSDGKVTDREIQIATALMDDMRLSGDARSEAQDAFREGKARDFPLNDMLKGFYDASHGRRDILQVFLEILIQAAFADGQLSQEEYAVLEKVAKPLGFRRRDLDYLISMYEAEIRFRQRQGQQGQTNSNRKRQHSGQQQTYSAQQTLDDAYRILGVDASDDEKVIKRAYRKRMSEHHPDKLVSKGLPEQAMEIAKKKAQDIQSAYELIKQRRGF
ncbi:MAG: co-chaperone DjlA [Alteromonas sp.]|jgi:DnaJ like chaperone protein|uniref:co-chaperone DjlA n=2 Tax=unclassified Alteromonas TaxID=2614992 RepID=UPI000903B59E|nr:co-chaperone DjlA [Alteromonas sp. RW2A1]APE04941.1 molecular chaperone DjlA [Alteromonas sp. RW2A1]MAI65287.1 co-chaperone DjlA [Alteromonas sp.]